MKIKLLMVLFLIQSHILLGSRVEDDQLDSFKDMSIPVQSHTIQPPTLNYEDMHAIFLAAPSPRTLVLEDTLTGLTVSWDLEWHTNLVHKNDLVTPSSEYKPYVNMMCARGLHIMHGNDRFVTYRVDFEHEKTQEVMSPFYNVFYLKKPKILLDGSNSHMLLENLVTPAPQIAKNSIASPKMDIVKVKPFMKDGIKEGPLTLPDPINSEHSYRWKFVWHNPFNKHFFTAYPQSTFTYQVSFIEDRGLDEKYKSLPFASYKVYIQNKHTLEIVDPFLVFYLQWPALA